MPRITIKIYDNDSGKTDEAVFDVPMQVTITGKEDHFGRACDDADRIVLGLRYAKPTANIWIHKVTMD